MKKILTIVLILAAAIGGGFGGMALKPQNEEMEAGEASEAAEVPPKPAAGPTDHEYVKFSRQFILPIVESAKVKSLIVADIQLEVVSGASSYAFARAPKLRSAFLEVLYRHAHTGSLKNSHLSDRTLTELRGDLLKSAREILGDQVHDVLITDLLRQQR